MSKVDEDDLFRACFDALEGASIGTHMCEETEIALATKIIAEFKAQGRTVRLSRVRDELRSQVRDNARA